MQTGGKYFERQILVFPKPGAFRAIIARLDVESIGRGLNPPISVGKE